MSEIESNNIGATARCNTEIQMVPKNDMMEITNLYYQWVDTVAVPDVKFFYKIGKEFYTAADEKIVHCNKSTLVHVPPFKFNVYGSKIIALPLEPIREIMIVQQVGDRFVELTPRCLGAKSMGWELLVDISGVSTLTFLDRSLVDALYYHVINHYNPNGITNEVFDEILTLRPGHQVGRKKISNLYFYDKNLIGFFYIFDGKVYTASLTHLTSILSSQELIVNGIKIPPFGAYLSRHSIKAKVSKSSHSHISLEQLLNGTDVLLSGPSGMDNCDIYRVEIPANNYVDERGLFPVD